MEGKKPDVSGNSRGNGVSVGFKATGASGMTIDQLPEWLREIYEERAAIHEFEGGMSRDMAEQKAMEYVKNYIDLAEEE